MASEQEIKLNDEFELIDAVERWKEIIVEINSVHK